VRLTPKSGRDSIDGPVRLADGSEVLSARVRAAPSEGAANAALLMLLAKTLGVPKSAVTLIAGESARLKRIHIRGDSAVLAAVMNKRAPPASP
jgi:uncharacterized protein YggU (UPF0235/DUF167 family)